MVGKINLPGPPAHTQISGVFPHLAVLAVRRPDGVPRERARELLARNFDGLWVKAGRFDALEDAALALNGDEHWAQEQKIDSVIF